MFWTLVIAVSDSLKDEEVKRLALKKLPCLEMTINEIAKGHFREINIERIKEFEDKIYHRNIQIKDLRLLLCKIYQTLIDKKYDLAKELSCSREPKEHLDTNR